MTSGYVAVSPSITGVGSTPNLDDSDTHSPDAVRVCAISSDPPGENRTGAAEAAGTHQSPS